MFQESERGAALIAAAFLDDALLELLRAVLVDEPEIVTRLVGDETGSNNAPLSTFATRINLCYCLGLLDPDTQHDLKLIGRIRNKFAHRR
ncbi:MAG: transcriptional regulator, partial [Isosphaeraceae bacterium]